MYIKNGLEYLSRFLVRHIRLTAAQCLRSKAQNLFAVLCKRLKPVGQIEPFGLWRQGSGTIYHSTSV